jgi:hypothetical protein
MGVVSLKMMSLELWFRICFERRNIASSMAWTSWRFPRWHEHHEDPPSGPFLDYQLSQLSPDDASFQWSPESTCLCFVGARGENGENTPLGNGLAILPWLSLLLFRKSQNYYELLTPEIGLFCFKTCKTDFKKW